MLEKGVIELLISVWVLNLVLVLKLNGDIRVCVDY